MCEDEDFRKWCWRISRRTGETQEVAIVIVHFVGRCISLACSDNADGGND